MSFIKSIVGWFKRKKDEPKCLSDVISKITPVSTPLSKSVILNDLSADIIKKRQEIMVAKKAKKRSSLLQKELDFLVSRKLELEGK